MTKASTTRFVNFCIGTSRSFAGWRRHLPVGGCDLRKGRSLLTPAPCKVYSPARCKWEAFSALWERPPSIFWDAKFGKRCQSGNGVRETVSGTISWLSGTVSWAPVIAQGVFPSEFATKKRYLTPFSHRFHEKTVPDRFPFLLTPFSLTLGLAMSPDQLVVLQGKPLPSAGDMYLAGQYAISIRSAFPERREILSLGRFTRAAEDLSLQSASDGRIMVYWQYWRPLSLRTRKWLPDMGPQNAKVKSIYSPDLKYYLVREPDDSPDHFTLYLTATGERLHAFPKVQDVYDAAWSQNSKRLALVVVPVGVSASNYHENLVVYSVP